MKQTLTVEPARYLAETGAGNVTAIVAALRSDLDLCASHARVTSILAIRIGFRLLWIKQALKHGKLLDFMRKHLPGYEPRTLQNYMRIASECGEAVRLINAKTQKLGNANKLAPILEHEPGIIVGTANPAKADASIKKILKWIADRSLTQIYKDLADTSEADDGEEGDESNPLNRTGKKPGRKESKREIAMRDMRDAWSSFKANYEARHWEMLEDEELTEMKETFTEGAEKVANMLNKRRK